MSAFGALDIAATGADLGRTWLDVVAHNVANVDTVRPASEEPFRAKLVVASERAGGGVSVAGLVEASGEPALVYDPANPLADEDGMVAMPVVDLSAQMVDLMAAQRAYQANLSVVRSSRDAYEASLRIGR